ncbi:Hypothetical protein KVN_LOCUS48 [uncultured virus]|nr:Hypothetical protein KVN_LOCUS48 [uncultured virus]
MHISILILIPNNVIDETNYINSELEKVSGIQSRYVNIDELELAYENIHNVKSFEEFCNLLGFKNDSELNGFRKIIKYYVGKDLLDKQFHYIIHDSKLSTGHKDNKILEIEDKNSIEWRQEFSEIINLHLDDEFVLVDVHI